MRHYDERPESFDNELDICECGHKRYSHGLKFLSWIMCRSPNGKCFRCMCSRFKTEKKHDGTWGYFD